MLTNVLNRIKKYTISLYLVCIVTFTLQSQGLSSDLLLRVESERVARVMFYNCENLFDTYNDTLKDDDKFLPEGEYHWSKSKYYKKLDYVSRVITSVGGWRPPGLVGLCEVENKKVLIDLTKKSSLYIFDYKIIHKESQDRRGIDVALLYLPKQYTPIQNEFIKIEFPNNKNKKTRDILYSKGVLITGDTIHVFVNHWPSRWGGQLESEKYRIRTASVLKSIVDSILNTNKLSHVVMIGDFNDTPTDKSVLEILNVNTDTLNINNGLLYNMTYLSKEYKNTGTIKYHMKWYKFDQILVSGSLLNKSNTINVDNFSIFNASFLLEKDIKYLGNKPFRTFVGYKYNGGYSDHLPVFIDFK